MNQTLGSFDYLDHVNIRDRRDMVVTDLDQFNVTVSSLPNLNLLSTRTSLLFPLNEMKINLPERSSDIVCHTVISGPF